MIGFIFLISPVEFGYAITAANISASTSDLKSLSITLIFNGLALVSITAFTCGCRLESITNAASSLPCQTRRANVIASAAAVASSSIEAFAIASPVKSVTAV